MPLLGRLVAGLFGDGGRREPGARVHVRNPELVGHPPTGARAPVGYALAPAVVVTQTLVELTGMVVLTRVVPAWLVPESPDHFLDLDVGRGD